VQREAIESTTIVSIGYDRSSETLEVEFSQAGVYRYHAVPASLYEALMSAGSKGRFLQTWIKPEYQSSRVE